MAEVVGTVAAAIEFSKALLKLKEFYSSIRHAPEELSDLIEELNLTDDILQTLADQDAFLSIYAPPAVVQKCRDSCKKAVEIVNPVCIQLSKSIERSRWRGSLNTVLKDGFLEKARRRIERAKINLLLAQTAASSAMSALNLRQHASTQALIASALTVTSPLPRQHRDDGFSNQDAAQSMSSSMAYCYDQNHTGNPDTVSRVQRRPARGRLRQYTTSLLVLQNLWLGKRFEVIRERTPGISTFTIRAYNILPRDAPAFRLAAQDDLAGLQALFQTQQATDFDRNELGETLLHVASHRNYPSMMKFLVQQGCDPNESDFRGHTCFSCLIWSNCVIDAESLHALAGSSNGELMVDAEVEPVHLALVLHPDCIRKMIPKLSPPWYTLDLTTRLNSAYYECKSDGSADNFWMLLSQRQLHASSLTRTLNAAKDTHESLVGCLAFVMSADCEDLQGWRSVLRSAVMLNGFGLSFGKRCPSPMLLCLGAFDGTFHGSLSDLNNQRLSCKLRNWAYEVHRAGEDLQRYGRWEKDLLDASGSVFRMDRHSHIYCRFLNLVYGPSPADWQIWASTLLDEHAGELWQGVEHAEAVPEIPGSWRMTESYISDGFDEDPQDTSPGREEGVDDINATLT